MCSSTPGLVSSPNPALKPLSLSSLSATLQTVGPRRAPNSSSDLLFTSGLPLFLSPSPSPFLSPGLWAKGRPPSPLCLSLSLSLSPSLSTYTYLPSYISTTPCREADRRRRPSRWHSPMLRRAAPKQRGAPSSDVGTTVVASCGLGS